MIIHESAENYLETILILLNKKGQVRSIDVAAELGYSKPSISIKMKQFRENHLISMDAQGFISLTTAGREIAERIYDRHLTLSSMLIKLGVDEKTAREDACRMEHVISEETFQKIKQHIQADQS